MKPGPIESMRHDDLRRLGTAAAASALRGVGALRGGRRVDRAARDQHQRGQAARRAATQTRRRVVGTSTAYRDRRPTTARGSRRPRRNRGRLLIVGVGARPLPPWPGTGCAPGVVASSSTLRTRTISGVTSTHSSSAQNSIACSRPSSSGRASVSKTSAVDDRMLVSFFSRVTLTSRSSARGLMPTTWPS